MNLLADEYYSMWMSFHFNPFLSLVLFFSGTHKSMFLWTTPSTSASCAPLIFSPAPFSLSPQIDYRVCCCHCFLRSEIFSLFSHDRRCSRRKWWTRPGHPLEALGKLSRSEWLPGLREAAGGRWEETENVKNRNYDYPVACEAAGNKTLIFQGLQQTNVKVDFSAYLMKNETWGVVWKRVKMTAFEFFINV